MMFLSNLAEPDWVSVDCVDKHLYYIVCVSKKNKSMGKFIPINKRSLKIICHGSTVVLFKSACYTFIWLDKISTGVNMCTSLKGSFNKY